jgi:hypothetical protein
MVAAVASHVAIGKNKTKARNEIRKQAGFGTLKDRITNFLQANCER